jgi:hypothetical protein
MTRGPGVALIVLVFGVIALAITTWAASPIAGNDSAGPNSPREVIYRPQHLLLY